MSNLLKNITNSLLEAEDDLFPGLDSSTFDEHNKIMVKRPQLEELERVEGQIERVVALQNANDTQIAQMLNKLRSQKLFVPLWQTSSNHTEYKSIPWIAAKYPAAAVNLEQFAFDHTIHPVATIRPVVAMVNQIYGRRIQIKERMKKVKAKGTRLRKASSSTVIDRQKKENPVGAAIPDSQIPKQFRATYFGDQWMVTGGSWTTEDIENPYFDYKKNTTEIEKYAGHPAHYKWQKREITQYIMLSNFVKRLRLPELNILYLKRIENYKTGKTYLQYYMANSDKSFQFTRGAWGANVIYTKDTRVTNFNANFNNSFIIDAKKEIADTAIALKKFKGKKP